MALLVRVDVPHDLGSRPINDSIRRWSHRVSIAVVALRRDSEMCGGDEDIREVPTKCDHLIGCDFVEGCDRRWGLSDGQGACCCSGRDGDG